MPGYSNVSSDFESGNLVFRDKNKDAVFSIDGSGTGLVGKPGFVADASITVGDETGGLNRAITIQLKDANGADITSRQVVRAILFNDANGDTVLTNNPSSGLVIGTDGTLSIDALIAGQTTKGSVFTLVSEADGDIDLTWTDAGTAAAYLGIVLPTGRLVMSSALTNS